MGETGHQTVQGKREVEMKYYSWCQDSGYVSLFFFFSLSKHSAKLLAV